VVRLVDDLLDVARITRGKIHLQTEPLEVAVAVAKAAEMVRPFVEERAQRLTVAVPEHGLLVMADEARLVQAIANLLSNASKYTEPGGAIALDAETTDTAAILRVRDSGIGIAPEALRRIFHLFVQETPALDRSRGGLGVGLTVVKELVRLHGGSVSARSEGLGHGSEFVIRLPLMPFWKTANPAISDGPATLVAPGRSDDLRVLLVDDNADAADMVGAGLQAMGYVVRVTYDGPSALSAAMDFKPDVALVDIGLPGIDGYELAARLREMDVGRSMRLVALTGYGQERDFRRSREAGFDEHLVKPVDFEKLEGVLQRRAT
jgi:CheY-like chemotaxis protein